MKARRWNPSGGRPVISDLEGTDEPIFEWEYAGSRYRLSNVGGIMRFEQEIRGGWYLIEPSHDTTSVMLCAQQLGDRLRHAESEILHLKGARISGQGAGR